MTPGTGARRRRKNWLTPKQAAAFNYACLKIAAAIVIAALIVAR